MQTAPVPASVRFPHAGQVFVLTRHVTDLAGGHPRTEVCYGITSLDAGRAGPARLTVLVRGQWQIESLHWVRDVVFDEDRSQVRTGQGPQVMATLLVTWRSAGSAWGRAAQHRRRAALGGMGPLPRVRPARHLTPHPAHPPALLPAGLSGTPGNADRPGPRARRPWGPARLARRGTVYSILPGSPGAPCWRDLVSSGSVVPPGPTRRRLRVGTILWALIPALSLGLLAPVPFAHAAVRLKQRRLWAVTAAYAIGSLGWLVGVATPEGGWGDLLFGIVVIALMVVGTAHAFVLRGRVFAPRAAPPATDPALAAALAARKRREEARAIATGDVALARELRIGRPELPRQFDDGGLVDVNHVPAQVLVDRLGLSPAQAGQVVEARERLGGFAGPEELIACSGLPEATVSGLRERLLFLAVERAADTQDDRPEPPAAEDGQGVPPPGWYPDPAGGLGRRWWDGTHWLDRVAGPITTAKETSRNLSVAFSLEIVFVLGSWLLAWILLLGVANCGASARCDDLWRAWLLLMVAHPALLVVCGVMFIVGARTKRVAVKRWAVLALPIGTVTAWIPFAVMIEIATGA